MENQTGQTPKKKSKTTIILIIVTVVVGSLIALIILTLLTTDTYLYLRKNKSDTTIVYQNTEKTRLQTDLDSLEDQMKNINAGMPGLPNAMQAENDSLQTKILALRRQLAKGKITMKQLDQAREDVKQLRYFVTEYAANSQEFKKQKTSAASGRDTLKTTIKIEKKTDTALIKQPKP